MKKEENSTPQKIGRALPRRSMQRADFAAFADYILPVLERALEPGSRLEHVLLMARLTDTHTLADVSVISLPEGGEDNLPAKAATLLHIKSEFDVACLVIEGYSATYPARHSRHLESAEEPLERCLVLSFYSWDGQAFLTAQIDPENGGVCQGELVVLSASNQEQIEEVLLH